MGLFFLGLNHRSTSVEIRERFAIAPRDIETILGELLDSPSSTAALDEVAVVSTCNRFELYGVSPNEDGAAAHLCERMAYRAGLDPEVLTPYFVQGRQTEVALHLCAVAAGLDSMILGEPQILGQVVEAYESATRCGAAGPLLAALFRKAIECGKRARTETEIGSHSVSVSSVSVELASQTFGSLKDRCVLLIGAGEMAELAARGFADTGVGRILVVNRSIENGQRLAQQFGGAVYGWADLDAALREADIVLCSAAAPHPVVRADLVRGLMPLRNHRPLLLVDIAVPRTVEDDVGTVAGVSLHDIDDLKFVAQRNLAQRQAEVPKVEAIVTGCAAEYGSWVRSLDVVDTIQDIRSIVTRIRDDEVDRALRRLGPLNQREERIVRTLGHSIVNKLLHAPTVRLKEFAQDGDGGRYADALRDLFGLDCSETSRAVASACETVHGGNRS